MKENNMREKMLVLLAASAFLLMACDLTSVVSQFLPREVGEAQATLQAVTTKVAAMITNVAPTLQSVQTQVAPTLRAAQTALPPVVTGSTPFVSTPVATRAAASS